MARSTPRRKRGFGQLRKLPSGMWQAGYTGPDTRMHYAPHTFETAEDAEGWLAAERRILAADPEEWLPPKQRGRRRPRLTFGQYADTWLEARDIKPRTRAHYRDILDRIVLPEFGDLPLRAITPASVREWHADLPRALPTQRAHAYSLLRTVLNAAVADELIAANPCKVRGGGQVRRAHKIRPATVDELVTIAEHMPDRLRLMVLFAAWCGLRFGETAELRRRDIDQPNGLIRVRRAVVRAAGETIVGDPKSAAGVRDVAIPPHLMPAVVEHLNQYAAPGRDGLLFPAANGGHLAPSTLYRSWYPAREAAGRPDLRWHDLRHTGMTLAAATGATLGELMARLGHSTIGAATKYVHASQNSDQRIAAGLSAIATGGNVVPITAKKPTTAKEQTS